MPNATNLAGSNNAQANLPKELLHQSSLNRRPSTLNLRHMSNIYLNNIDYNDSQSGANPSSSKLTSFNTISMNNKRSAIASSTASANKLSGNRKMYVSCENVSGGFKEFKDVFETKRASGGNNNEGGIKEIHHINPNFLYNFDEFDDEDFDMDNTIKEKFMKRYNSLTTLLMRSFRKAKNKKKNQAAMMIHEEPALISSVRHQQFGIQNQGAKYSKISEEALSVNQTQAFDSDTAKNDDSPVEENFEVNIRKRQQKSGNPTPTSTPKISLNRSSVRSNNPSSGKTPERKPSNRESDQSSTPRNSLTASKKKQAPVLSAQAISSVNNSKPSKATKAEEKPSKSNYNIEHADKGFSGDSSVRSKLKKVKDQQNLINTRISLDKLVSNIKKEISGSSDKKKKSNSSSDDANGSSETSTDSDDDEDEEDDDDDSENENSMPIFIGARLISNEFVDLAAQQKQTKEKESKSGLYHKSGKSIKSTLDLPSQMETSQASKKTGDHPKYGSTLTLMPTQSSPKAKKAPALAPMPESQLERAAIQKKLISASSHVNNLNIKSNFDSKKGPNLSNDAKAMQTLNSRTALSKIPTMISSMQSTQSRGSIGSTSKAASSQFSAGSPSKQESKQQAQKPPPLPMPPQQQQQTMPSSQLKTSSSMHVTAKDSVIDYFKSKANVPKLAAKFNNISQTQMGSKGVTLESYVSTSDLSKIPKIREPESQPSAPSKDQRSRAMLHDLQNQEKQSESKDNEAHQAAANLRRNKTFTQELQDLLREHKCKSINTSMSTRDLSNEVKPKMTSTSDDEDDKRKIKNSIMANINKMLRDHSTPPHATQDYLKMISEEKTEKEFGGVSDMNAASSRVNDVKALYKSHTELLKQANSNRSPQRPGPNNIPTSMSTSNFSNEKAPKNQTPLLKLATLERDNASELDHIKRHQELGSKLTSSSTAFLETIYASNHSGDLIEAASARYPKALQQFVQQKVQQPPVRSKDGGLENASLERKPSHLEQKGFEIGASNPNSLKRGQDSCLDAIYDDLNFHQINESSASPYLPHHSQANYNFHSCYDTSNGLFNDTINSNDFKELVDVLARQDDEFKSKFFDCLMIKLWDTRLPYSDYLQLNKLMTTLFGDSYHKMQKMYEERNSLKNAFNNNTNYMDFTSLGPIVDENSTKNRRDSKPPGPLEAEHIVNLMKLYLDLKQTEKPPAPAANNFKLHNPEEHVKAAELDVLPTPPAPAMLPNPDSADLGPYSNLSNLINSLKHREAINKMEYEVHQSKLIYESDLIASSIGANGTALDQEPSMSEKVKNLNEEKELFNSNEDVANKNTNWLNSNTPEDNSSFEELIYEQYLNMAQNGKPGPLMNQAKTDASRLSASNLLNIDDSMSENMFSRNKLRNTTTPSMFRRRSQLPFAELAHIYSAPPKNHPESAKSNHNSQPQDNRQQDKNFMSNMALQAKFIESLRVSHMEQANASQKNATVSKRKSSSNIPDIVIESTIEYNSQNSSQEESITTPTQDKVNKAEESSAKSASLKRSQANESGNSNDESGKPSDGSGNSKNASGDSGSGSGNGNISKTVSSKRHLQQFLMSNCKNLSKAYREPRQQNAPALSVISLAQPPKPKIVSTSNLPAIGTNTPPPPQANPNLTHQSHLEKELFQRKLLQIRNTQEIFGNGNRSGPHQQHHHQQIMNHDGQTAEDKAAKAKMISDHNQQQKQGVNPCNESQVKAIQPPQIKQMQHTVKMNASCKNLMFTTKRPEDIPSAKSGMLYCKTEQKRPLMHMIKGGANTNNLMTGLSNQLQSNGHHFGSNKVLNKLNVTNSITNLYQNTKMVTSNGVVNPNHNSNMPPNAQAYKNSYHLHYSAHTHISNNIISNNNERFPKNMLDSHGLNGQDFEPKMPSGMGNMQGPIKKQMEKDLFNSIFELAKKSQSMQNNNGSGMPSSANDHCNMSSPLTVITGSPSTRMAPGGQGNIQAVTTTTYLQQYETIPQRYYKLEKQELQQAYY